MAQPRSGRYETVRGPVYEPVYQSRYEPRYELRYEPVYAAPRTAKRKVVVHRHKVIVKHVYVDRNHGGKRHMKRNKRSNKRAWEKRRRELAQTCYEHPRRCSKAF